MIAGLCGSVAIDSVNRRLLRAIERKLAEKSVSLSIEPSFEEIPYFHPEWTTGEKIPAEVKALKVRLASAKAFVVSSPEYGHAIPGVFKNTIDWLYSGDDLRGKPLLLASVASSGGPRVLDQLFDVFQVLGAEVLIPPLSLYPADVRKMFTDSGEEGDLGALGLSSTDLLRIEDAKKSIDLSIDAFIQKVKMKP